ncbi:MAG: fatty acid desaturase, partial [Pseudomonadota bacterium]|nr:fatty acid desaturase [Pseudomonadota bacterium]
MTKEERVRLRKPDNIKAMAMFAFNWSLIATCFAVIAVTDSLILVLLALLVMAGRQLGIGILLHECSHNGFFSTKRLNQNIGHWLAGMPLLVPMNFYRPYHMTHHSKTGTDADPDVHNIKQYPVSKVSMARKILRDFAGLSGMKMLFGVLFYVLPQREGNTVSMGASVSNTKSGSSHRFGTTITNITHAALFHA